MGGGIGGVRELSGDEAAGNFFRQLLRAGDGSRHAARPLGEHQFRTVSAHQQTPLHAHGLRHDDDGPVAPGRRHGGQADAGIPGGWFDDDRAGAQQPPGFGIVDHGFGHTVLGAPRRVEVFQLRQNTGLQALLPLQAGQLQQRRFSDQLVRRCINIPHTSLLTIKSFAGLFKGRGVQTLGGHRPPQLKPPKGRLTG